MNNEFLTLKNKANDAINLYNKICDKYPKKKPPLKTTINKWYAPFKKGYFTLAVVGKLSAGKSSFINALLGERDILPTGKLQTTSIPTIIIYSEKAFVEITYGDGEIIRIEETENLREQIRGYVSIPDEYQDLPINLINDYILNGDSTELILSRKKDLEKKNGYEFDERQLKEYINAHPKSKIATKITIGFPLSKDFEGWRIIDTPGVNAIGGYEDKTFDFLDKKDEDGNREVDAIIFVHNGQSNIQDSGLVDFVKKTCQKYQKCKNFFFVLTHNIDIDNEKKEKEFVHKLFGHYISEERIICVDSLAELLYSYVEKERKREEYKSILNTKDTPIKWTEVEWKECRKIKLAIKDRIECEEKEDNNETYRSLVVEMSNFSCLRNYLNNFAKEEKGKVCEQLLKNIQDALSDIKKSLQSERGEYEKKLNPKVNDKNVYEEWRTNIEKTINSLNCKLTDIEEKYASKKSIKDAFDPIIEKLEQELDDCLEQELDDCNKIEGVKHAVNTAFDDFESKITQWIEDIKQQVQDIIALQFVENNIYIPIIDFAEIEKNATHLEAKKTPRKVDEPGFWGKLKRIISFGKWGTKTKDDTIFVHTFKMDEFKKQIKQKIKENRKKIQEALEKYFESIQKEIKKQIAKAMNEQEQLMTTIQEQTNTIQELEEIIKLYDENIEDVGEGMKKLNDIAI